MTAPPADLREWAFRVGELPIPESVVRPEHIHWRGESQSVYALSSPITDVSFDVAVREAVSGLWVEVVRRLGNLPVCRGPEVALPAIRFQETYEGLRLRAQTLIAWSEMIENAADSSIHDDIEIGLPV